MPTKNVTLAINNDNFPDRLTREPAVVLERDKQRLLLAFVKPLRRFEAKAFSKALKPMNLVAEDYPDNYIKEFSHPYEKVNHTGQRIWVRSSNQATITEVAIKDIEGSLRAPLDWIGGVYKFPGYEDRTGLLCPLPHVLLIKPMSGLEPHDEKALLAELKKEGLVEVPELSQYSGDYRYFRLKNRKDQAVYGFHQRLLRNEAGRLRGFIVDARLANMPLLVPEAQFPTDPPNDEKYGAGPTGQWNLRQIEAGSRNPGDSNGWSISTGSPEVVVWLLDTRGAAIGHPDLSLYDNGMVFEGDNPPWRIDHETGGWGEHATKCAGIVAARTNNDKGVAGVAGGGVPTGSHEQSEGCKIFPLATLLGVDAGMAHAIRYAVQQAEVLKEWNVAARVISCSLGTPTWDPTLIDSAIEEAFNANFVICAASGNVYSVAEEAVNNIDYPAKNKLVIACGASDQQDYRVSFSSTYGWGSAYGPELSIVAPGIGIPTTDLPDAYYTDAYFGTSAATPHVAGLAALLLSTYRNLRNGQIRDIVERTAKYVNPVSSSTQLKKNGRWNRETGYGRINVLGALKFPPTDFADVMIRDYPGDTGGEPSTPPGGDYWSASDIVVRPGDDGEFVPDDPLQSSQVARARDNYLYVRVTNNGPKNARNVVVNARITPYVGLQFVYPDDWNVEDTTHVKPKPVTVAFPTVPAGGTVTAKFGITLAQVEELWGWVSGMAWHPCVLAEVTADNDYMLNSPPLAGRSPALIRNNLAQRNLSVIPVSPGMTVKFPFLVGHRFNPDKIVEILIQHGFPGVGPQPLPPLAFRLSLDDGGRAFPQMEKLTARIDRVLGGGKITTRNNQRFVGISKAKTIVRMEKQPNKVSAVALQTQIPQTAKKGQSYMLKVSQRNQKGQTVGGATAVYLII